MDESEDNMSAEDSKYDNGVTVKVKSKKRSLVERELETNLTPRVTSPIVCDGVSTSRYGRARKLKADIDFCDTERMVPKVLKSPKLEKSPVKIQSPVYKMHASNSPLRMSSPKRVISLESSIENQIEKICSENISLSRFGSEENSKVSPAKKFTKIYVRKDLIQNKEKEETVTLIKNMFSPIKSASKTNTHLNNILERSSEKYSLNRNFSAKPQNGYSNMASVVKTLDFDSKKKKKDKDKMVLSKNELFDIEARCQYQVGDLAWARVGTYPFWPCIITRDPESETFVKNKLFGRVERDVIHVTFFGDNGRRGWIVDNMLRKYTGLLEFESARKQFTPEAKKKDPRFYAAFFISEKKQHLWNISVEEAELLFREPKRLRIDIFNEMLEKSRASKITPKRERSRKVTRTNSDVSLSESLYDTLFSEDDGKSDDHDRSKNRSRNKSLDVSEVVTACLDNMAAKTGITKIQRQSHMDRWLQKAKSKTPEKSQPKCQVILHKVDKESKVNKTKNKRPLPKLNPSQKLYTLRRSLNESQTSSETKLTPHQNEHDYSIQSSCVGGDVVKESDKVTKDTKENEPCILDEPVCGIGYISKVESLFDKPEENLSNVEENDVIMTVVNDEYFGTEQDVAEEIIVKEVDTVDITNVNTEKIDKTKVKAMNIDTSNIKNIALTEMDEYEHLNFISNSYKLEEQLNKIYTVFNIPQCNKNIEKSKKNNGNMNDCKGNKIKKNYCAKLNKTCVVNAKPILANDKINLESEDKLKEKSIIDKNRTEIGQIVKTEIIPDIDMGSSKSTNVDIIVKKNDNNISINEKEPKYNDNKKEQSSILKQSLGENFTAKGFVEDATDKEVINDSDVINKNTEETKTKSGNEEIVKINHMSKDIQSDLSSRKCDTSTDKTINDDISEAENLEECIAPEEKDKIYITSKDEIKEHNADNNALVNMINKGVLKVSQSNDQHTEPRDIDSTEVCKRIDEGDEDKVNENNNIKSSEELEPNKISNDANITHTKHPDVNCKDESTKILDDMVLSIVNCSPNATVSNDKLLFDRRVLEIESIKEDSLHEDAENKSEKILKDDLETVKSEEIELSLTHTKHPDVNCKDGSTKILDDMVLSIVNCSPNATVSNDKLLSDRRALEIKAIKEDGLHEDAENTSEKILKDDLETASVKSEESELSLTHTKHADVNCKDGSTKILDDMVLSIVSCSPNATVSNDKLLSDRRALEIKAIKEVGLHEDAENTSEKILKDDLETASVKSEESDLSLTHTKHADVNCKDGSTKILDDMVLSIDNCSPNATVSNDKLLSDRRVFEIKAIKEDGLHEDAENTSEKILKDDLETASVKSEESELSLIHTKHADVNCKDGSTKILDDMMLSIVNCSPNATVSNDKLLSDRRALEIKSTKKDGLHEDAENTAEKILKDDLETVSVKSEESELSLIEHKTRTKKKEKHTNTVSEQVLNNPDFMKYLQYRQDELMDEHPELVYDEIVAYLYKTWLYEENLKSHSKKADDIEASNLVKGLNTEQSQNKSKRKVKDKTNKVTRFNTLDEYLNKQIPIKADKHQEAEDFEKLGDKNVADITNIENTILSGKTDVDNSEDDIQCKIAKPTDEQDSYVNKLTETKEDLEITDHLQKKTIQIVEDEADLRNTPISEDVAKNISVNDKNENNIIENKIVETECDHPEIDKNNDKLNDRKLTPVENNFPEHSLELVKQNSVKYEIDSETASINSEDSISTGKRRMRVKNSDKLITKNNMSKALEDPEFLKYLELRQDALIDEHQELTQDEIVSYLYSTWVYEESLKSERMKTDEIDHSNLVKGLNQEPVSQAKKVKRKPKVEKTITSYFNLETTPKDKPNRSTVKPYYNEDFSDVEEEIEFFEIFKREKKEKANEEKTTKPFQVEPIKTEISEENEEITEFDEMNEVELYFADLTKPKPNIFKGLVREKVCEICEKSLDLVKCNGCRGMFHVDCVKKELEVVEVPIPIRGRKKKKKPRGRKSKNLDDSNGVDSESQSDDKSQDANVSEEQNMSIDDEFESHLVIEAETFEAQLSAKMKEMLESAENIEYESPSEELDWSDTEVGKCQIVDIKVRMKDRNTMDNIDYSDFKCNNCQKYDIPICFVCKSAVSPKAQNEHRQRCQIAHCHKYYHIECLDHWPQTHFNSWEPSKNYESLSCPRHVCHTCVSDDPRGCKTRFSGDKLARCVRCPATYHSFTRCLPAGSQILTASHIICPRHYEHRPGKVPCHVNTGWCFICALGGTLICCEYCPTSFHAECLNIKPPEGGYMCEDCETGRLPLYGEMVWVKLGHYRWWPGIILHPSEIPHNIMAVKHSPGEFVVRFFGQYDYYWVNRGRVFPFQEGDSGRVSSQRSKIDAAFTTAMEHAQKAFEILKKAHLNQEESQDIAMSLLPPHYVKLKVNKPCGTLCGRKVDVEESSLTQCECNPDEEDPCGPYSQCLNRMLLTECGPTCKAGDRCNNRAFEKRLYPKLMPYRTPQRGWGLKTLEDIKQGQFVIEYVGELIDEAEFQRRMRRKHETRDENFYFLTLDKERMIDAGPKGNLARFMNHCCEPNCETQKWTVLGDVRVGLFALHDIPANGEVTFNYNLECAGIDKKRCLCGAKRCSGYIGAKPKQDESQPKKGKFPAAKRTYKKRKNIEESPSTSKSKTVKQKTVKPIKPKELTEIEKDLIIIKNATNSLSSDSESSGRLSSIESDRANQSRPLKRKRVSFSTDEVSICNSGEAKSQTVKRVRLNEDIVNGDICH